MRFGIQISFKWVWKQIPPQDKVGMAMNRLAPLALEPSNSQESFSECHCNFTTKGSLECDHTWKQWKSWELKSGSLQKSNYKGLMD